MKQVLRTLVPVLLLLTFLGDAAFAQQARIATVDLRKVFDNYWKRKQADAAVKERAASMEKEHGNMLADWRKAREEYQAIVASAQDQAVSNEEREKRKKAGEEKLKQLKLTEESIAQYEKTARSTLEEQLKRMRENILGEIRTVITAKATAAGYTLVFDTAAETPNNTPVVLYSSGKDNDLTDAVLQQLNAVAPPDTATTPTTAPKADEKKK